MGNIIVALGLLFTSIVACLIGGYIYGMHTECSWLVDCLFSATDGAAVALFISGAIQFIRKS